MLNNVEDGTCRYYYAHEKNTLMKRSEFVMTKYVLVKMKNVFSKTDVIEACTNERAKTTENFYKLTVVTVFAFLLREVFWGIKTQYCQGHFQKTTQLSV